MSFILDALKKSETERQQQSSAEFASVPTSRGTQGMPRWLWALGLLLAINLAVLLGLFLRPDVPPAVELPSPIIEAQSSVVDNTSFAQKVDQVRRDTRVRPIPDAAVVGDPDTEIIAAAPVESPATSPPQTAALPTIFEVRTSGTVEIPDLHLDIHVYSDVPEDRFVFINMSKHREDSRLSEGPVVEEITPDGVVLEHRGTSFLLPRD